jgi:uncharacterized protein (DUF2236 family)
VDSALLFEELTVGHLDDVGRQRFHEEQKLAAELVLVPRDIIPPTFRDLRAYLRDVEGSGILRVSEAAERVAALFDHPPKEAEWRPVLRGVSRLAFGTLPEPVRDLYGIEVTPTRRAAMAATWPAIRALRPLLPPRYRYIAPYQEWLLRRRGRASTGELERVRRAAGIRLDRTKSIGG